MKPYHGPRDASYEIRLDGQPHAATSGMRRTVAYSELDYWRREGRAAVLVRIEHCPQPGCLGHRPIVERRVRGRMFPVQSPCPHHLAEAEIVEAVSPVPPQENPA